MPYATMLRIFFENGFKKKKTKIEAKLGSFSTNDKISLGHAHTQTHTSTEMLSDKNGTKAAVRPTLSSTRSSVPAKFLSM